MFQRILLPLDGSELAETALPYGRELARKLESELMLFHVCGPEHKEQKHMHQVYLSTLAENQRNDFRRSARSNAAEVKVSTKIETGAPKENVCNIVEKNSIDLIVLSALGASGVKVGKLIGSVADHVCRNVPIPVMLIKPQRAIEINGRRQLINRILLTVDGSELSLMAVPVAGDLASSLKVPVTIFQMARMVIPYGDDATGGGYADYTRLNQDVEEQVRSEVIEVETRLKAKGLDVNHDVVTGSSAADEILDAVKRTGSDLIIMSTHGRSGLGRWVLGNVAERVLRSSEVPVLLVNARVI